MKNKYVLISIFLACFSSNALANFIYSLDVTGNWEGNGQIEFSSLTGASITGITSFSFTVSNAGFGAPQTYDLSDINTVTWAIDAITLELTELLLRTNLTDFSAQQSGLVLNNTVVGQTSVCSGGRTNSGSISCETTNTGAGISPSGILSATPINVSEPGALGLAFISLLVLFLRNKS